MQDPSSSIIFLIPFDSEIRKKSPLFVRSNLLALNGSLVVRVYILRDMSIPLSNLLEKKYPQNFIIRKPFIGALLILAISFVFIVLYKPFHVHPARTFSFAFTMAAYCFSMAIPVFVIARILKLFSFFSEGSNWTLGKEITAAMLTLLGMGLFVYFTGFIMEEPADRWNWSTFSSSMLIGILVGLVPVSFFTLINFRYLFVKDISLEYHPVTYHAGHRQNIDKISIPSQLKKEELRFHPEEMVYAESDGNYVVFYLQANDQLQKRMVRNSMQQIEQHLSGFRFILRVHRAFMVNLKCICSVKGNSLGYRIRLTGTDAEIPVSRQNARHFIELLRQYQ